MKKEVVMQMTKEFEATPIAHLVQLANQFESSIYLEMNSKKVNAKSIMGMMSLIISAGDTVTIDAEGADEEEACKALEEFLTK